MKTRRNSSNSIKAAPVADNAAILAKVAELLKASKMAIVDEPADEPAPQPAAVKAPKADRLYEIAAIGADFRKNRLYATPISEAAATYMMQQKALCADTLAEISAPIASEVKRIAEKAENNAGESLKDDLIALCDTWKIPAQSMRVIMQLCAPVVACCNAESDEIARRCYGMARANALMGSACNMLMYSKAADKAAAIPFKRVAHNLTALGLDFDAVATVGDCDFCDSDEKFTELCTLCDMWLNKCEKIEKAAPQPAAPQVIRRGRKASIKAAEPVAAPQDNNSAILAEVMRLLGMMDK